jgi:hypothetical protein
MRGTGTGFSGGRLIGMHLSGMLLYFEEEALTGLCHGHPQLCRPIVARFEVALLVTDSRDSRDSQNFNDKNYFMRE